MIIGTGTSLKYGELKEDHNYPCENDYDGVYLYNLQPNNDTDCFSEYLCTLYFERVINCIANTLKISIVFL
jgi:hypothetical protein